MENRKQILRKKFLRKHYSIVLSCQYLTYFRKNVLSSQAVQMEGQMVLPHTVQIKENTIENILIPLISCIIRHMMRFELEVTLFIFLHQKEPFNP